MHVDIDRMYSHGHTHRFANYPHDRYKLRSCFSTRRTCQKYRVFVWRSALAYIMTWKSSLKSEFCSATMLRLLLTYLHTCPRGPVWPPTHTAWTSLHPCKPLSIPPWSWLSWEWSLQGQDCSESHAPLQPSCARAFVFTHVSWCMYAVVSWMRKVAKASTVLLVHALNSAFHALCVFYEWYIHHLHSMFQMRESFALQTCVLHTRCK